MAKFILVTLLLLGFIGAVLDIEDTRTHNIAQAAPIAPASLDPTNKQFIAALDVARVFGRSTGCAEADPKLINEIAEEAVKVNLDPRILAATVAVESACNQYATSSKGAIGLTQIMPKVWKGSYDFEHQYNLLNPHDNIRVGASILAGLVKQYGLPAGLRHYDGTGTDCPTCDLAYVDKIAGLAAKR